MNVPNRMRLIYLAGNANLGMRISYITEITYHKGAVPSLPPLELARSLEPWSWVCLKMI